MRVTHTDEHIFIDNGNGSRRFESIAEAVYIADSIIMRARKINQDEVGTAYLSDHRPDYEYPVKCENCSHYKVCLFVAGSNEFINKMSVTASAWVFIRTAIRMAMAASCTWFDVVREVEEDA